MDWAMRRLRRTINMGGTRWWRVSARYAKPRVRMNSAQVAFVTYKGKRTRSWLLLEKQCHTPQTHMPIQALDGKATSYHYNTNTMKDELFANETSYSPRKKWMAYKSILCKREGEGWMCYRSGTQTFAKADTEENACTELAIKLKINCWKKWL